MEPLDAAQTSVAEIPQTAFAEVRPAVAIGTQRFTGADTGAETVTSPAPVPPPLVAVIVAWPGATALTTPVAASTVATFGLRVAHVAVGLATRSPFGSRTCTASGAVAPTAASAEPLGSTVTVLVAPGCTVTVTLPVLPPGAVAVTPAVPVCTAVTRPVDACTLATAVSALDQVNVTPATMSLAASRAVAASCCLAP